MGGARLIEVIGWLEIGRVSERVIRAAKQRKNIGIPNIRGQRAIESQVVHILRPTERAKELGNVGGPPADFIGEGLDHSDRALAATPEYSVANFEPIAASDGVREEIGPDESADIGNNPVLARLDEEVVPQIVEILPQIGDLLGNHLHEC